MKILLTLLLIVAVWHFVYECIIAPSIRLNLRNRLFALRDELRQAKIDGISKEDEKAFWFIHKGINTFLNRLPSLTIDVMFELDAEYERDESVKRSLDEKIATVEKCKDFRIRKVFDEANKILDNAIITNAGGWFIYVIPVAIVFLTMGKLSKFTAELIVSPTKNVDQFIPCVHT